VKAIRRTAAGARPFLVLVRAGDGSLHRSWMRPGQPRSWDLMVNYYGADPGYDEPDADFLVPGGVTKFPAIKQIDDANPGLLRSYRAIFMPDDDVDIAFDDVDRAFALCEAYGLWLAQPSLTHDSHASWNVLFNCRLFEVHFTNIAEVMAPIFSQLAFARCVSTFDQSISSFGLDLVWPLVLGSPTDRVGVLNEVQMRHVRRIDRAEGAFYRYLRSLGVDPDQELKTMLARYGMREWKQMVYGYLVVTPEGLVRRRL
jgi:hypothetical protein